MGGSTFTLVRLATGQKHEQHVLLVSQPDGTYNNESISRGLAWHEFNWGTDFVDLNNDGAPDLITVGAEEFSLWIDLINPGAIFVNDGEGNFSRVEENLGLANDRCSGLASADFNEDESQDVMVVCASATRDLFLTYLQAQGGSTCTKARLMEVVTSASNWKECRAIGRPLGIRASLREWRDPLQ